jgi:hypothetical protein
MQFHAESVLTRNGPHIIGSLLAHLAPCAEPEPAGAPVPLAVGAADGAPSKDR